MKQLKRTLVAAILLFMTGAGAVSSDLDALRVEEDDKKRAKLAMRFAHDALDKARKSWRQGNMESVNAALNTLREAVDLTYESLQAVDKEPRKMSKHYKRAEISCRKLLRRMDSFRNEMSFLDREKINEVIESVQKTQTDLLHDVMGVR